MQTNVAPATTDTICPAGAVAGIDGVEQRLSPLNGLRGAYWFRPIDGHGMSMSLWGDKAAAEAVASAIGPSPEPGMTVEWVGTRPVIAQAWTAGASGTA